MDGSHIPPDKRYLLLDRELADKLEKLHPRLLLEVKRVVDLLGCECGCDGRRHGWWVREDF